MRAGGTGVNGARQDLLADAGLAEDEDVDRRARRRAACSYRRRIAGSRMMTPGAASLRSGAAVERPMAQHHAGRSEQEKVANCQRGLALE